MAQLARQKHQRALNEGELTTSYLQVDEMETFEHTRRKPYNIAIGVRPKTREIVFARLSLCTLRLEMPKQAKIEWNKGRDTERI